MPRSLWVRLAFVAIGLSLFPSRCDSFPAQATNTASPPTFSLQSNIDYSRLDPTVAYRVQRAFESATTSVRTLNGIRVATPGFTESVNQTVTFLNGTANRLNEGAKLNDSDAEKVTDAAMDLT